MASAPIGAVRYHSRLHWVDLLGLTCAAIRHAPPDLSIVMKGHHRYAAERALDQRPDVVILGNGVVLADTRGLVVDPWERALYQHPRFQAEYEPHVMPICGSDRLPYFQRRGGLQPSASGGASVRPPRPPRMPAPILWPRVETAA